MKAFTIFPAMDLRRGEIVRLQQGDPARQKTYSRNPEAIAMRWLKAGAHWLHVVNLDGAFGERSQENLEALQAILATGAQVQFGGGLRSLEDLESALQLGVRRAVLGTAAVENPEVVKQGLDRFGPERIAVGIDADMGRVRVRGWRRETEANPLDLAEQLCGYGLSTIIVTDISRDGMGEGVNQVLACEIAARTGLSVVAAGGVASLSDVRRARQAGLQGIIIGRALYEGDLALEEALEC
jgi:phosphoribosylformimino-5-aminoimidazole carboxamide ribotide isomerase